MIPPTDLQAAFDGVLEAGQVCAVPRGTRHHPVADAECAIVPIEAATPEHTGGALTPRMRSIPEQLAAPRRWNGSAYGARRRH